VTRRSDRKKRTTAFATPLIVETTSELFEEGRTLKSDLDSVALAAYVQVRLRAARQYVQKSRSLWRVLATTNHLVTLALSAGATVLLGFAQLSGLASWGFVLSALVTTFAAIEPYYNWRSRWVGAEEALADWYRIEEDLTIYVASTDPQKVGRQEIMEFDKRFVLVWEKFNNHWLDGRKGN